MPDVFVSKSIPTPTEVPKTESQKIKIPGHTHNKLSAFCLYPENIDFETRETEEKIILLLRAHPITNLKWILVTILMSLVPGIVGGFGFFAFFPFSFGIVITLAWYLITSAYALESFLSWYFNVYFVTTLRVIDVDFYNLVYKEVSDANINKIQDVSYNMGGVARTVFNYGNVFIQTAAEVSEFDFFAVPYPDRVAKIIEDLIVKDDEKGDNV
jgi:hypothetical protein